MVEHITISEKLIKLLDKKREIKNKKHEVVRSQKYEEAAQLRNEERKVIDEIKEVLDKSTIGYLRPYNQYAEDLWTLFDLVEPGEKTFENAFTRMKPEDIERMYLVQEIEKYKEGEINLEQLHNIIKGSFGFVKKNFELGLKQEILDSISKIL